jgi:tetratricopeptide (TPR) repeat protein
VSLPSPAEVDHADWPVLKRMCESLGLNPKGRSGVVRMRLADYVRRRTRPEAWRLEREHEAALLTRLGFSEAAERLWESTIQLDAPAPWVGLGHAHLAAGHPREAAKAFERAAHMADSRADLHLAEAQATAGDLDAATRACDTYLAAYPGDARALALKASYLARGGFVDEAARVLRGVMEIHPGLPGIARALGVLLLKTGRIEAAEAAFHEAIRQHPADVEAWTNRGAALLLAARPREAIGVLREALELDPRRVEALNNLGVAYLALGHTRSAQINIERAAKHQETPRIVLNLARIREMSKDRPAALRAVDQVLRMKPKDSEALATRRRLKPRARPPRKRRAAVRRRPRPRPRGRRTKQRSRRPTGKR